MIGARPSDHELAKRRCADALVVDRLDVLHRESGLLDIAIHGLVDEMSERQVGVDLLEYPRGAWKVGHDGGERKKIARDEGAEERDGEHEIRGPESLERRPVNAPAALVPPS